ncbi:MAG: hypothetical protein V4773_25430 [Verrucomicrobiota bacterium]
MNSTTPHSDDVAALRRRKFEAEMEAIRQEAARHYAHLPRPTKVFNGPWSFHRSRRRHRLA